MTSSLIMHVGLAGAGTRYLRTVLAAGHRELTAAGVLCLEAGSAQAEPDRLRAQLARGDLRVLLRADEPVPAVHLPTEPTVPSEPTDPTVPTSVVITARDLGRYLPDRWLADVASGGVDTLDAFVERVVTDRPAPFDLPGAVARWTEVVGADGVVVVTVPQHGAEPGLLWSRFAEATGLPTDLAAGVAAADRDAGHRDDVRLSASQAQMLRGLNEVLRADGHSLVAQAAVRARLLQSWQALDTEPGSGGRVGSGGSGGVEAGTGGRTTVPGRWRAAVRERAAEDVARLRASGVRVVGPLTDLEPRLGPAGALDPPAVDAALARDVLALLTRDPSATPPAGRLARAVRGWTGRRHRSAGVVAATVPAPRVSHPAGSAQPWAVAGDRSMSGSR